MKTVLGLHHKILPPTIHHHQPNPAIPWDQTPFYVVTVPEAWPANNGGLPRRANVSSFGFGGTNFHIALEEHDERYHMRFASPNNRSTRAPGSSEPIAIIGLGAILPKASTAQAFWENILGRVNAVSEVPLDRWEGKVDLFFDPDPEASDKTYGKLYTKTAATGSPSNSAIKGIAPGEKPEGLASIKSDQTVA